MTTKVLTKRSVRSMGKHDGSQFLATLDVRAWAIAIVDEMLAQENIRSGSTIMIDVRIKIEEEPCEDLQQNLFENP